MLMLKKEKETDVKAKIIWSIGRLANGCEDGVNSIIQSKFINYLDCLPHT